MSLFVNGPINVVRMEGYIGKIKKVVYIYFDFHFQIPKQTRCNDITSVDIKKHLVTTFKKLENENKIYDFFFETDIQDLDNYKYGYGHNNYKQNFKEKYIDELGKLFNVNFGNKHLTENTIDPVDKKIILKKENPLFKTRFHYVDIRSLFGRDFISFNSFTISRILDNIARFVTLPDDEYPKIIDEISNLKNYASHIVESLQMDNVFDLKNLNKYNNDNNNNNNKYTKTNYMNTRDTRNYLLNKIKNKYNNRLVKNSINNLIKHVSKIYENVIKNIDLFLDKLDIVKNFIAKKHTLQFDDVINKYVYGLSFVRFYKETNELKKLYDLIKFDSEVWIMDIYTLRRILDKDYVTNSIVYCGAHHSCNYVYVLNKYFDFKITHASYSAIDLDVLNSITKDCNFDNSYQMLAKNLYPQKFSQCSDMSNFPPDFS